MQVPLQLVDGKPHPCLRSLWARMELTRRSYGGYDGMTSHMAARYAPLPPQYPDMAGIVYKATSVLD